HGDADKLVPIQQAESIIARFKEVGVPAKLVVKEGAGHGWSNMIKDVAIIADWFDKHLAKPGGERPERPRKPADAPPAASKFLPTATGCVSVAVRRFVQGIAASLTGAA